MTSIDRAYLLLPREDQLFVVRCLAAFKVEDLSAVPSLARTVQMLAARIADQHHPPQALETAWAIAGRMLHRDGRALLRVWQLWRARDARLS